MAPSTFQELGSLTCSINLKDVMLDKNWEDVQCPICLDFPHNGVLLCCSSYGKGCRPFMCNTDCAHSNCFDRFKSACSTSEASRVLDALGGNSGEASHLTIAKTYDLPLCPLCRGELIGWIVVSEVRAHFDAKKRFCSEENCAYSGNYEELQRHMAQCHPLARPSEVDPVRKLEWENFERSSELIDVLNIIHSEIPNGVVLGDYVIEYAGNETGDEYDDYHGDQRNRWTSCFARQIFNPLFSCRAGSRRRSRQRGMRPHRQQWEDGSSPPEAAVDTARYSFTVANDIVEADVSARSLGHLRFMQRHHSHVQGR